MDFLGNEAGNGMSKKQKRIIRTWEEPVLPALCRILFWFMILLTGSMALVDISSFVRYGSHYGIGRLFQNLFTTGFVSWMLFSVLLIPLSYMGIRQIRRRFLQISGSAGEEKSRVPGADVPVSKAQRHMEEVFTGYQRFCVAGLAVWGAGFLLTRFL